MKRILILSILSLSLCKSYAQDSRYNSVQLAWGIGNIMRQDLTLSPFVHEDWSLVNAYLNYSRSKKLEQQITLKIGLYDPFGTKPYEFTSFYNGTSTTIPHSFKMLDIDYSLGKELFHKTKWSFVLGGKSRNFIYASDYYFGESGPSPVSISFGLGIWLKAVYWLNEKNYIISNLSAPAVSYVYRNPYLTQDDEYFENIYSHNGFKEFASRIADGELRSWGKVQQVEFDIHYGYSINHRWDIGISYLFSMNLNQHPAQFTQFENTFLFGGKIKF